MFDVLVTPASLALFRGSASDPMPEPYSIDTIVIEGDSLTGAVPDQAGDRAGFYSYAYADDPANAPVTFRVRAQSSRVIGPIEDLDEGGNALIGQVAEDAAFGPDLITALIGSNDMGSGTAAAYADNLIDYYGALRAADPGLRFAWSPPPPYNPLEPRHPSYDNFTAQRALLLADCRDPAVWGQWADYYLPMGEHPDFTDFAQAGDLYGDGIHPTAMDHVPSGGGQDKLYEIFKPAVDTLRDQARAAATAPYESVWPQDETNLATATEIVRRFIVSGIAHTGLASGVGAAGADARVRLNGGAYELSTGRIYNGDVIDLKLTTSDTASTAAQVALTIGSETRPIGFTTAAAVAEVTIGISGHAVSPEPSLNVEFTAALGVGINDLRFTCHSASGNAAASSVPTSVKLRASGSPNDGSQDIAALPVVSGGYAGNRQMAAFVAEVPADGTYTVMTVRPNAAIANLMAFTQLPNADPVPVAASITYPANEANPHLTAPVTVPEHGIALGSLMKDRAAAGDVNAPTQGLLDQQVTQTGNTAGFVCGYRTDSGPLSFTTAFGTFNRGWVVFKALGT